MAIVIGVAWYAVSACGGMAALLSRLGEMRAASPGAGDATSFFPDFSRPISAEALWVLPVVTFLVNIGVQWWSFWYPGAEPGGGGYIAQRIFSAKDERNGLLSVLWFNIAHYALRPWPWILTALAAIVLYPHLEHTEIGYMLIFSNHVPPALRGIVIAGFMAAFMSTIATQLNWGASYLVADFYRRFIKRDGDEKHYVNMSRVATVILVIASALVSVLLADIRSGWQAVLEVGAGTGAVYLLRWYWWRINAWSEISAMATALLMTVLLLWAEIWLHGFWAALWFTWRCLAWGTCSLGRCGRDSFCCSFPLFVRAFFIRIFRGAAGRRMAQRPSAPKNKVWSVQRPASCPPPLR